MTTRRKNQAALREAKAALKDSRNLLNTFERTPQLQTLVKRAVEGSKAVEQKIDEILAAL